MVSIESEIYSVNHSEIGEFYDNNQLSINELYNEIPEEERIRVGAEILYGAKWDNKLLGEFKGGIYALTLAYVIQKIFGSYIINKYASVVLNKGNPSYAHTEEEFDKMFIETLYNQLMPNPDPLQGKLLKL